MGVELGCTHFTDGRRTIAETEHWTVHIVLLSLRARSHDGVGYDVTSCRTDGCVV